MRTDVKHVADLAKLRLSPEELAAMEKDLEMILAHIERLAGVDVEGIEPTFGSREPSAVRLQPDVVEVGLSRAGLLESAPQTQDGYYVVPKEGRP